ncbi:UDP-N-acetylglucosamine--N-acetylmuramyl-(pentapeptide) pyrophosphoryl-undecaprenol N-acetylglucosamine transferase [Arthrobacter woluwensis]|uniref:undecaprenyldiphospho-muramoylpentapeptide beta-N-acetylglucosaminyltransferase n=1 Tax=Arthrobacter woluwensis TaxID=156980 RepID=UPI002784E0D7|nr:undecaprenyldiphospho-muramoylpentapeptide beta-N-acetylglucosaminyltransferase [Arthrobacter woluwensis]MDQ0708480.1 UDP-N-acetylglucosamine--N-acetylmuramyl-(pentapeptide) pyrophosphoryl-undecaprenol N-acetylglucosamine transferase [Arthrobacter woluwensis]
MNTPSSLSVVIAGGGTTGHISPMLAVADALRARLPEARVVAVGTATGMETRLVPAAGYELKTIDRVPLPRKPSADLLRLPGRLLGAVKQARAVLRDAEADVLFGVGGYVCTPMYLAARQLGIPVVVHEANVRPGLANRVGAMFAAATGTAFRETRLKGSRHVGMPMRRQIAQLDRESARAAAREALGLDQDRPTLIVTGGSSGAQSINTVISRSLPALAAAGIQTLHITGRGKSVLDASGAPLTAEGYRQVEYVDGMENVYAAADLLLCRSGAGTVCEVSAVGVPAVFVPLPIGNGEQALNAAGLVDAGGALLVKDADLNTVYLEGTVIPLVQDAETLRAMAAVARQQGIRDADERVTDMMVEAARV